MFCQNEMASNSANVETRGVYICSKYDIVKGTTSLLEAQFRIIAKLNLIKQTVVINSYKNLFNVLRNYNVENIAYIP